MKCSACPRELPVNPATGEAYGIPFVIEEWMSDIFAPGTYMVCPTCFLHAFVDFRFSNRKGAKR